MACVSPCDLKTSAVTLAGAAAKAEARRRLNSCSSRGWNGGCGTYGIEGAAWSSTAGGPVLLAPAMHKVSMVYLRPPPGQSQSSQSFAVYGPTYVEHR